MKITDLQQLIIEIDKEVTSLR